MDIKQLKELQCHLHDTKPETVRLMTVRERAERWRNKHNE